MDHQTLFHVVYLFLSTCMLMAFMMGMALAGSLLATVRESDLMYGGITSIFIGLMLVVFAVEVTNAIPILFRFDVLTGAFIFYVMSIFVCYAAMAHCQFGTEIPTLNQKRVITYSPLTNTLFVALIWFVWTIQVIYNIYFICKSAYQTRKVVHDKS